MKKSAISILLYLLSSFFTLFSTPFYVSPNGSDSNHGTKDRSFATILGALKKIQTLRNEGEIKGNIELIIQNGEYRLAKPIIISNNLWDGKDTLFVRGEKNYQPVIKGSIKIGFFEKITDSLWKIDLSESTVYGNNNIQQLFVNGKRAIRARTPNLGTSFQLAKTQEIILDSTNNITGGMALQKIFLTKDQLETIVPTLPETSNVIISINHAWDRTREFIQYVSPQDSALFIINRPMPQWNKLNNSSHFFFENSEKFLDSPGEWHINKAGTLLYYPQKDDDIETCIAEIPIIDQILVIDGTENKMIENIVIENLSFQHTRQIMTVEGEHPNQAGTFFPAAIELNFTRNILLDQCEIANVSNYAIWFKERCSYVTMTKCHVHNLGIGGVKIGNIRRPSEGVPVTNNVVIDNNIIQSGGYEVPTGVGVIIYHASDNTVSHNDIADFRYSGVSVGFVWGYTPSVAKRNKIIYNRIHHLGWGELSDMGGVYLLGKSEGTIVSNNVIHDIYSYSYGGWGLYTDEGSTGIVMENNLVYNCKSSGFHQHYGRDNIIRNNIFANNLIAQLQATRVEPHNSFTFTNNIIYFSSGSLLGTENWHKLNFISNYNSYWDTRSKDVYFADMTFKQWQSLGNDEYSIIADPHFVDAKNFNFNFKNKSTIKKIGFKPFNYNEAGVYGTEAWVNKSMLDLQVINAFNETVAKLKLQQ